MTGGYGYFQNGGEWPENFPDKYCHLHIEFKDGSKAVYRDKSPIWHT